MYQAVTNIPNNPRASEKQAIIRAIPDIKNDRNGLSRTTIYECAKRQIEAFRSTRVPVLKPQSYIEQILDDLCMNSSEILYCRNPRNAYQVLYAMCIILRARKPMTNKECCLADNIQELLSGNEDFCDCDWVICVDTPQEVTGEKLELRRFLPRPMLITENKQPVYISVQGDFIIGDKKVENEYKLTNGLLSINN